MSTTPHIFSFSSSQIGIVVVKFSWMLITETEACEKIPGRYQSLLMDGFYHAFIPTDAGPALAQTFSGLAIDALSFDCFFKKDGVLPSFQRESNVTAVYSALGTIVSPTLPPGYAGIVGLGGEPIIIPKGTSRLWLFCVKCPATANLVAHCAGRHGLVGVEERMILERLKIGVNPGGFMETKILYWLARLLDCIHAKPMEDEKAERTLQQIQALKEYLFNNFEKSMTISLACKKLGIQFTAVRRSWAQYERISMGEYLLNLRINEAKRLLIETTMPIYSIAWSAGYQSSTSFTRVFAIKTGCSPKVFRIKYGKKND